MQTTEQNYTAKSRKTKKVWQKPDFTVISHGYDVIEKNNFATNENSLIDNGVGVFYKVGYTLSDAPYIGFKSAFHS